MDKKIEETREFLQTIGMPKAQQADICCYVILAMAGIKPDMSWSEATNEWIRIHDIIQFVNTFYGMSYAENSRETFRKQALHRFRTAALIEDNGKARLMYFGKFLCSKYILEENNLAPFWL